MLQNQRGITVGDVIASIAILSLLSAFAAPHVARLARIYALRGATLQVFAELQNARSAAVATGNQYAFQITNGGRGYEIYDDQNRDGVFAASERIRSRRIDHETPNMRLSGSRVVFAPNGTALLARRVTLTDSGFGTQGIDVGAAGRVRLGS